MYELKRGELRTAPARVLYILSVLVAVASPVVVVVAVIVGGREAVFPLLGLLLVWLIWTALMPWAAGRTR